MPRAKEHLEPPEARRTKGNIFPENFRRNHGQGQYHDFRLLAPRGLGGRQKGEGVELCGDEWQIDFWR